MLVDSNWRSISLRILLSHSLSFIAVYSETTQSFDRLVDSGVKEYSPVNIEPQMRLVDSNRHIVVFIGDMIPEEKCD